MIFNIAAAQVYNNLVPTTYRVHNLSDLVTMSPLPIMPNAMSFLHAGQHIVFQSNLADYARNHSAAYMDYYNLAYTQTSTRQLLAASP